MARKPPDRCHCGRPLHYIDAAARKSVDALVATLGPEMKVTIGRRSWMVPRHYIALHGITAGEIHRLGFAEVESTGLPGLSIGQAFS